MARVLEIPNQDEIAQHFPALMQELRAARRVLVSTHVNPDGDAIGSALAFSYFLDQHEIDHEVFTQDPPPYFLEFLPGVRKLHHAPKKGEFDLGVVLDLEALHRMGSAYDLMSKCDRLVVIDHHIPAEAPGDLRIVCTKSPATCSILFDLFEGNGEMITADMAQCLLTGMITDTGTFRFPNTDARALRAAAKLLEYGADLGRIVHEVYLNKERPAFDLLAYALAHAKTAGDGAIMWTELPYAIFEQHHAGDQHTEGIVNELLSVQGVKIAALLRETKGGRIKGSLRSIGDIDVAAVAREFGGGGHKNAAGVSMTTSITDASSKLVASFEKCLASS